METCIIIIISTLLSGLGNLGLRIAEQQRMTQEEAEQHPTVRYQTKNRTWCGFKLVDHYLPGDEPNYDDIELLLKQPGVVYARIIGGPWCCLTEEGWIASV